MCNLLLLVIPNPLKDFLVGISLPVKQFTRWGGGWIAVVHRYDDKEEKWVVAPETQTFSMDDIKKEIHFQEQYFDSEVIMLDT